MTRPASSSSSILCWLGLRKWRLAVAQQNLSSCSEASGSEPRRASMAAGERVELVVLEFILRRGGGSRLTMVELMLGATASADKRD